MDTLPPQPAFRIAVIQMESHPAITVEAADGTAEPFFDNEKHSVLATLLRYDDGNGIQGLQDTFRQTYLKWAMIRLKGVLKWLFQDKDQPINPDIVVFSEFAIPFEHLHILRDFAHEHNCIIIAGNHSYNRRGDDYAHLGFIPPMPPPNPDGANSLLVAFAKPEKNAQTTEQQNGAWCRYKYKLSPFEFTTFHTESPPTNREAHLPKPATVWKFVNPFGIAIDILICAEALQDVSCDKSANMLIVCAYHTKPNDYDHILNQTAKLQKLAVLASEGRFGKSAINLNYDNRFASWWLHEPNNGALPAGNGVLVYDVPYTHVSASAGSANPFKEYKVVRIADIVSGDKNDEHYLVNQQIQKLIKPKFECESRYQQINLARNIRNILRLRKPSAIQKIKFHYLADAAQLGQLTPGLLEALADDCVYREE